MGEFLREEVSAGRTYLPAGENVLRAFQQPFHQVKVLIVGQDPYPTPGHAVGLSFSVAPDVRPIPKSLINIYKEYAEDLGHPIPSNGDLTPWSERGVLLLNRALTVQPGKANSHQGKGWEKVTEQAIKALAVRDAPLVSILWGRNARNLRPLLEPLPPSSPRIRRRFPRTPGSSGRSRSAAPTNCWRSRAPTRSTGSSLNSLIPARLAPLTSRGVRGIVDLSFVAAGAAVSEFGNSLSLLVLLFWATPISSLLVAAILIAELLPFVLGAPLSGMLVDRLPNRRLLIVALLCQGVAIAAIAPLMGQPAFVVALVFLSGCGRAIAVPATSALVPHIAGEEESTRGYAWLGTARSVGNLSGVTGGALLAGFFGHSAAMLIDGVTFIVFAALLAFVRSERRPSGEHETRPSALAGIRHVRRDPVLFAAVVGLACFVGAVVVINVADPAFVRYVLNGDEFLLGAIQACWMVGIIFGNRLAARLRSVSQIAYALAITGITTGIAVLIPAAFPFVAASAIGWFIGGVSNGVDNVTINAIVRLRTPEEMRGRAFAAVGSMVTGANLLGTAAAGGLLLVMGPRAVFALGGTGALLSGAACLVFVHRALKREEPGRSRALLELKTNCGGDQPRTTLPAFRQDVHTLIRWRCEAEDLGAHRLDVRVPAAVRLPLGVRNRMAEARPLATDVAHGSHVSHSFRFLKR